MNKRVRAATTVQIANTALRFQRNNLVAKFNSYQGYWNRIMRQIEEGTYKRDRLRAAKISAAQPAQPAQPAPEAAKVPADSPAPKAPPAAVPKSLETIYSEYKFALAALGQNTNLSYAALSSALTKQSNMLKDKYGCRDVHFRVAVENGKVQIKAVPVK